MPSFQPAHKLLLDENVRVELFRFLKASGVDVKLAPRGAPDKELVEKSRKENRILVTNDKDFSAYSKEEVFAVVWLRIPQNNAEALLGSFEKLLKEVKDFSGSLVVLNPKGLQEFPLGEYRS